jgi:hypothetical protein
MNMTNTEKRRVCQICGSERVVDLHPGSYLRNGAYFCKGLALRYSFWSRSAHHGRAAQVACPQDAVGCFAVAIFRYRNPDQRETEHKMRNCELIKFPMIRVSVYSMLTAYSRMATGAPISSFLSSLPTPSMTHLL